MSEDIEEWTAQIHQGDAADLLGQMPESSVHMVMCSPPYYGLRDYNVDGQIGLEESIDEYIQSLLDVASELRRVLRDDGSWWLNLGDTFADKQKQFIPHRVAMTLQDAGWVARGDYLWVKPNSMPQSVTDRLTETKEFLFHLTPKRHYKFDLDAIREPHADSTMQKIQGREGEQKVAGGRPGARAPMNNGHTDEIDGPVASHPVGKNPGDVFEIPTAKFPDAHFAVYPPELCEKPIKSSCPPTVCAECGTPYEREVEETERPDLRPRDVEPERYSRNSTQSDDRSKWIGTPKERETGGWSKRCDCDVDETVPGIALDPFAGAGTTCLVAKQLGRRFIGLELNPEYVAMAQKRVGVTVDEPEHLRRADEQPLTAFTEADDD